MSNLIYLLSDAYKNMDHNIKQGDIKIYPKRKLAVFVLILIIIMAITIYYIMNYKNINSNFITLLLLLMYSFMIACIWSLEKINTRKYGDNKNNYYKRINIFRNILKNEFKVYSRKKVKNLIFQCEEEIRSLEKPTEYTEKFISIASKIIYPVFAVIVSIFITTDKPNMNLSQESIITTIVIIAISFVFISTLLYLLLYISAIANRKIIKDLKILNNVLNDIYTLNFSDFE
ncbi:hypothetical protein [Romboutsia sp.]|uniref:hypothetical protein n=1 Tax=Romboutsia sp. TaxID=1965302 RepID=UPI003F2BAB91